MHPGTVRVTGARLALTIALEAAAVAALVGALVAGCVAGRQGAEQSSPVSATGETGWDTDSDRTPSVGASVTDPVTDAVTDLVPDTPGDAGSPSTPSGAGLAALPAGAVPTAPIPRFTCPATTVQVNNAEQLASALESATPGQVIQLADATFTGTFATRASGASSAPIYLCGGRGAVIDGGSITGGYALHFDRASHWRVSGFTVRNGQKGVMIDTGTDISLQDLLVEHVGDEAVHLRKNSTGNVVRGLTVRDTGNRRAKFGEGIYVGSAESNWSSITGGQPDTSNRNFILENTIAATTAEAVDIKEGTTGGVLAGNTFDGSRLKGADSWVDVKGNGWLIAGNTGRTTEKDGFQTHVVVDGWGDHNVFVGNVADLGGGSGVGFYLHEPLSNRVDCGNRVRAGSLSNHPCTG